MSAPEITGRFPLAWPLGRPKTRSRQFALWRHEGRRLTLDRAMRRLREQVNMLTKPGQNWRVKDQVLTTNLELRRDGHPRADRRSPDDVGVAFYFTFDGQPHVLACDKWDTIADNVAAIAAHIEALRGQERWGVADLRQAFAGHVALPAPEQWWQVLGVGEHATPDEIKGAYRRLAPEAHPDRGGSDAAMARLNAARDDGLRRDQQR
jgi:hypothetical protein